MANPQFTNAVKNRMLMEVVKAIDEVAGAGQLDLMDGSQPADPDTAITSQTTLASLPLSNPCIKAWTVTAASWVGGVATVTIGAHSHTVGARAVVAGITPSGYNGEVEITAIAATTISYAVAGDPGAYTSGGTVKLVSDGEILLDAITDDNVVAGGPYTVSWARLYADTGATEVYDGQVTVTGGGGDIAYNTVTLESAKAASISSGKIRF